MDHSSLKDEINLKDVVMDRIGSVLVSWFVIDSETERTKSPLFRQGKYPPALQLLSVEALNHKKLQLNLYNKNNKIFP